MNKIIIGKRNIGKTTFLIDKIEECINNGKKVALLDSATEHKEKSLIHKFMKSHKNYFLLMPKDIKEIVLENDSENYYQACKNSSIYNKILENIDKTLCVDLSYFLERGHEYFDDKKFFEANCYRYYYNLASQQVATCLMILVKENYIENLSVFSDEIEYPKFNFNIADYQSNNISFFASVHPENAFGTFYQSYKKHKFIPYEQELINEYKKR